MFLTLKALPLVDPLCLSKFLEEEFVFEMVVAT
jgi:hypothetical protein